jgi:hypothetical protein
MFQTGSAEKSVTEVVSFRVAFRVGERLSTKNQEELTLFLMANGVSDIQLTRRGLTGRCTASTFENSISRLSEYSQLSDDLRSKIESVYIPTHQPLFG